MDGQDDFLLEFNRNAAHYGESLADPRIGPPRPTPQLGHHLAAVEAHAMMDGQCQRREEHLRRLDVPTALKEQMADNPLSPRCQGGGQRGQGNQEGAPKKRQCPRRRRQPRKLKKPLQRNCKGGRGPEATDAPAEDDATKEDDKLDLG